MKDNNNYTQLTLPLYSDNDIEYKDAIKQNWKFTFSRQHLTTVHSKRVIGLAIAQMKEEGEMREVYHIRAADIIRKTDVAKEEVYRTMRGIVFELTNIAFFFENEKEDTIIPRHLLDTTRYDKPVSYSKGMLTLAFNPTLRDIILELAHYSAFELDSYMKFSSWYSMRIWELLSAYKDTGWWEVTIEEYRELMGCGLVYNNLGKPKKDKQGKNEYVKYPNTSDMIRKTTSEPLKELKGTELEFTVTPIKKSVNVGRPQIISLRFELVEHQLTPKEKIERWCKTSEKFANMYPRLQKWKVSDENIVTYSGAIGFERLNQLLFSWQNKNIAGAKNPIQDPLTYCNKVFVIEGQKAILKQDEMIEH